MIAAGVGEAYIGPTSSLHQAIQKVDGIFVNIGQAIAKGKG
jgi:hypothetical protein